MTHKAEPFVVGITPLGLPDPGLVHALHRAGALGVLDPGPDRPAARRALERLARKGIPFGVLLRQPEAWSPTDLPANARQVFLPADADPAPWRERQVFAVITEAAQALPAVEAGAEGLILRGHEAGGRVGSTCAFVLLQEVAALDPGVPVWVEGGIGEHTAAAAAAGGATGVVLVEQLALLRESGLPEVLRERLAALDGSETVVVAGGRRVLRRPGERLEELDEDEVRARLAAPLEHRLLPAGQAVGLAAPLADRHERVGRLVRGLQLAARGHLRQARATRPLAPGAPLARELGTESPIVQGPMTRVSDRAGFARAVADAGGLPFLALALLRGSQVEALLRETAELLEDRPWGVGILGFVPRELREEQLAVIRRFRPPFALIAGGRPSQARALEEAGTRTFLHVPSPGLLDLFLEEGARRFVFEGRECGGHVGPRSSFVLWQQALDRLLEHPAPRELSVLFAGGIHDARSAAMVAALAGPLAAAGARVGILMGTAYLFTHEAVATGAIHPFFQQAAIEADRTVLLETAPGHATRCAPTPYVHRFLEERRRLLAAGLDPREAWERLEAMNLGRLRLASKALRRADDRLEPVDEETQRAEGMVMLGQVAALRRSTLALAELHAAVTRGATELLDAAADPPAPRPDAQGVEVAIVGMAAILPGAPDVHRYWVNVVGGRNCVTEVPRERWNPDIHYDPEGGPDRTRSKWGGFLPAVPFDPVEWGIPPRSLAAIEAVQLLALRVARDALADAGHLDGDHERTSVIFGAEAGTDLAGAYGFRALFRQYVGELPEALAEALPALTEDSFPGVLANVIAGRIANRLDLGGVNYTVDAACASSLAAVDLACKELASGSSDLVICGGADLHNSIQDYLLFDAVHALSPQGRCATFDERADGIVLGEGVVAVVLKRLEDARRDGDRIYAVIKGVAGSSDGRALGLTAPRKEGQVRALERAYGRAGVSPAEVGLVEAHGTGTVVGDRTELATLTDLFTRAGALPGRTVLGSVKSQIGHTKCAAGLAGLVKAALALHHRVLPPTLHVRRPNPFHDPETSPFDLCGRARPWLADRRLAGVSAFGFGGTNFHVVLASEEPEAPPAPARTAELFAFRGTTPHRALARVDRVLELLHAGFDAPLAALARAVCADGREPVQLAVVATDLDDLQEKLERARGGRAGAGVIRRTAEVDGHLAFLFPGQGSQRPGMFAELFVAFPDLQRHLRPLGALARRIYPPTAHDPERRAAQRAALTDTRAAQPALGAVELAAAELLDRLGIRPAFLGGHSYGELAALAVAGALDPEDLPRLSAARAEAILAAAGREPGAMAAVDAAPEALGHLVEGLDVVVANHNAPRQVVLSGPEPAIAAALERLADAGVTARRIPVACAFHSPVVAGASKRLAHVLAGVPVRPPELPTWSNATASPHPSDPEAVRALLARQVAEPVRFVEQVLAMAEEGAAIFVEVGPGRVLSGLVDRILAGRPHLAVPIDVPGQDGLATFLEAVGTLAVHGVPVRFEALFSGRDLPEVDLDAPLPRRSPTTWWVNGHRAWPAEGELPAHGLRPVTEPVVSGLVVGGSGSDRDEVVLAALRAMETAVAAQRDIVLRYLGEAPAAPASHRASVEAARPVEIRAVEEPAPEPAPGGPAPDPGTLLLAVVSETTGYPVDMLDPDLDLEADLSIDSIKRIEIVGILAERLGLGQGDVAERDRILEELAGIRTLRAMLDWLEAHADGPGGPAGAPDGGTEPRGAGNPEVERATAAEAGGGPEERPAEGPPRRFAVVPHPAPPPRPGRLPGPMVVVVPDRQGVAEALAGRLRAAGARCALLAPGEDLPPRLDVLVDLAPLDGQPPPALFPRLRAALDRGVLGVLTATPGGGRWGADLPPADGADLPPGAGVAGFLRVLAIERPELRVRAVDLDPAEDAGRLSDLLFTELHSGDPPVTVGWRGDTRLVPELVPHELPEARGAAPLGTGDVAVLLGGARGIGAHLARALARRGLRLHLLGRSPAPGGEEGAFAGIEDEAELRRAIVAGGLRKPAAVESTLRRILADRAIRTTLDAVRAEGAEAAYHSVDARDAEALGALLDEIRRREGRIDLLVHAAGVIEDRLVAHKDPPSFERVWSTKVAPLPALLGALRAGGGTLVLFGSVAGVLGNRGQVDYAAANDALDQLARAWRGPGRVLAVDWGPWTGGGMVGIELERALRARGVELIEPPRGVAALLELLDRGAWGQVVVVQGDPRALASSPERDAALG